MNDSLIVTLVTVALIALSALFVIIEFALLGARRHRLEELAPTKRSARAALRGMNDLTLMLAGAQLGITVCTFALGAVTKPAVDAWLGPVLIASGMPVWLAGGASFGLSMFFVTFLHLVVGEMAPKSWAIAHPERSAMAIGLLSRAYIWPLRPLLSWVNRLANRLVRASGVEPVEKAAVGGRDAATIRQLVEHSAHAGTLEPGMQRQLSSLIDLGTLPVASLIGTAQMGAAPMQVAATATVADIRAAGRHTGHMRILMAGPDGAPPAIVHVRDTLLLPPEAPVAQIARQALELAPAMPVYEALHRMRGASVQLAVIMENGRLLGVLSLSDIVKQILPARAGASR
ncbi:HlyC/CorC family transporter [Paracoccus liaowanqingii]|uniref:HlyC/CorC family transporter n=1 Tax=Paracoccus liaowanqingii TaxID=2560053 RepID=A0A4Z1C7C6_9RHOB|nr:hemolysin family protein [Paracoccus liaowanqingii]TGN55712.1 HlyC/CorC family transporter [Paracoccus liaowanqingii]